MGEKTCPAWQSLSWSQCMAVHADSTLDSKVWNSQQVVTCLTNRGTCHLRSYSRAFSVETGSSQSPLHASSAIAFRVRFRVTTCVWSCNLECCSHARQVCSSRGVQPCNAAWWTWLTSLSGSPVTVECPRARPAHVVSETVDNKGVRRYAHNSGECKRADEAEVRISVTV